MKSMTGYGKGIAEDAERKICVEIKSVNHRFLDLNIKLPRNFNFAEDTLRRAVKGRVERGHLDIYVSYERRGNTKLVLNEELAKEYCTLAAKSKMKYNIGDDFGVSVLFKMPEVITSEEEDDDESGSRKIRGVKKSKKSKTTQKTSARDTGSDDMEEEDDDITIINEEL